MDISRHQQLLWIEKLIKNKEFHKALGEIDLINRKDLTGKDNALYCMLLAEANIRDGKYDVENELEIAIEYFRWSMDNVRFAKAKFLQGLLFECLGRFREARGALVEACSSYARCRNAVGKIPVLNRLNYIRYHLGEIDGAISDTMEILAIYKNLGDDRSWNIVANNLATYHAMAGRLSKAIELYTVIEPSVEGWDNRNKAIYYFMSALPYALRGDFEAAHQRISRAVPYLEGYRREEALYYEYLGWIYLLKEDYQKAAETMEKGLDISKDIAPKSPLVSQLLRRLAEANLGLKRYDLAEKYATMGLAVAEELPQPVEIAACNRVLAQLDCCEERTDKARTRFRLAIETLDRIGAQYELAITRYLAAASGLYEEGVRQAYLYIAREYFAGEEVSHLVAKIDREIGFGQVKSLPERDDGQCEVVDFVSNNPVMKAWIDLAKQIAPSDDTILITGESGVGKDHMAKYIHHLSGRPGKLVICNIAAVPNDMAEAELFGYKKGAFTGADQAKPGLFEEACDGTLVIDEIGDASPELQAKMLDAMDRKVIRRLGENKERKITCRIIATTHHDLENDIRKGFFRADLYYRINKRRIRIPPLRERSEDISPLLIHNLEKCSVKYDGNGDGLTLEKLATHFSAQEWPGNFREFEDAVKNLAISNDKNINRMAESVSSFVEQTENRLRWLLRECRWNQHAVARRLGRSEGFVRYQMKKFGIRRPPQNPPSPNTRPDA